MGTMQFLVLLMCILTAYGRNLRNAEFNEPPEEMLSAAVCRSFHKHNKSAISCDSNVCASAKQNFNFTDFDVPGNLSALHPQLVCKDDNTINLSWTTDADFAYFFEIIGDNKTFSNVTTCNYYTLDNLTEDTSYQIRLWGVSFAQKQILKSSPIDVRTSKRNVVPSPVEHISVKKLILREDVYDAVIEWHPNADYSCLYVLVWLGDEFVNEEHVNVVSGSHQVTLGSLAFRSNYTVEIMAKNKDSLYESPKKQLHFVTPSCLQTYRSLKKCRPEVPKNLTITESVVDSSRNKFLYDIHLSWAKPEFVPDFYTIRLVNINFGDANQTEKYFNISGSHTETVLPRIELGSLYHIILVACSSAGCSDKLGEDRHRAPITIAVPSNQWSIVTLVSIIVGLLFVCLCVFTVMTCVIKHYRSKQKRKEQRYKYFTELEDKLPESVDNVEIDLIKNEIPDQWEIDQSKLYFQSVIGEGAFGRVRRSFLEMKDGSKLEVAVKMLKESPTSEEIRQFTHEINIMKSVRQHPYIVSLIGCITDGRIEGPLLVVEYCSRGDLQSYLRNAWDKFSNMQQVINCEESTSPNYFANRAYDFHNMNLGDEFIIQPKHLLSIARQVSLGMEHLANTRVVHRDLAARNVLVCENHTVKVSDFGLSRDVYQDNVYCKSGGGKLPIRWMALESLTHQRYTSQSDVWSFGVLLWEIATLGSTPYPGVHSSDLLEFLKSGNRLTCPATCSPDLYAIMQDCWKASPKTRPTFAELCKSLEGLLENVSQYLRLENIVEAPPSHGDKFEGNKLNQSSSNERFYDLICE